MPLTEVTFNKFGLVFLPLDFSVLSYSTLQIYSFCATSISWCLSTCWYLVCLPGRVPSANISLRSEAGFSCSSIWHSASSMLKLKQEERQVGHYTLSMVSFTFIRGSWYEKNICMSFWHFISLNVSSPSLPSPIVCVCTAVGLRNSNCERRPCFGGYLVMPSEFWILFQTPLWMNSQCSGFVCFKQCVYEMWHFSFECQCWVGWIQIQYVVIHSASTELGRWELWPPEACVRGSSATNPAPAEFPTWLCASRSFG